MIVICSNLQYGNLLHSRQNAACNFLVVVIVARLVFEGVKSLNRDKKTFCCHLSVYVLVLFGDNNPSLVVDCGLGSFEVGICCRGSSKVSEGGGQC